MALRILLSALLAPAAGRAQDVGAPTIRQVEIRRENVFSADEAAHSFLYGFANALHAETREALIRRELLFRPGDPLNEDVLAESERRLRAFRLFRNVSVHSEGERVVVETADAWTLLPRLVASRKGGATTWGVGLDERNISGTGRWVSFRFDKGADRTQRSIELFDPDSLAPHTSTSISALGLSDGEALSVAVTRPFFELDAPFSLSALVRYARFDAHLWAGGEKEATWTERSRGARLEAGRLVSLADNRATRLLAAVEWSDTSLFAGTLGPAPHDGSRAFLWLLGGVETEGRRWLKVRGADRIERDEDFNLAPYLRVQAGGSPRTSRAMAAGYARAAGSLGTKIPHGFATLSASAESRWQDGPRASRLEAALKGFHLRPPVTVAARVAVRAGWRLDPEDRFELDGENGLRGYRLHAVNGTRNVVLNLEARRIVIPDLLHVVSLGVAAFADAGFSSGPPDGTRRLGDFGVGLRIGLGRASRHDLLRLDLARSFHPDPLGRTGWLLSFSSGQAF